jgi:asparagine synthase (glutamine-hydrolysing)
MCGILGCFDLGERLAPEVLTAARDTMTTRGPDDAGVWLADDGTAGLAHRRLSVIDPSSEGHQPMCNEDGSRWIVYNGETYNYLELRGDLLRRGHRFASRTDTEVVLHAYEEWGAACLERLEGIFAFAIWHVPEQRLFAARDRLGVKPLYYYRPQDRRFAFASQLKALMPLMKHGPRLDRESLWWYLHTRSVPAPRSILRDCQVLSAGHWLEYDLAASSLRVHQYWSPAQVGGDERLRASPEELQEELTRLLLAAVRKQLVADVPLGAFLSGGIDSTVVAAMMVRAQSKTATYTVGFADQYDEAPFAAALARYLGTEHHETYVTSRDMLNLVPELPALLDEPLADSSVIPTAALCRHAAESTTVALSGDGGDEVFGGYGRRYATFRRLAPLDRVPSRVRTRLADAGGLLGWTKPAKALELLDFEGLDGLADNLGACWRVRELDRLLSIPRPRRPRDCGPWEHDVLRTYWARDVAGRLCDEYLVKVDRASMAAALEVRVPLLDQRLVEFGLRLPTGLKVHGASYKVLLRRVAESLVPACLLDRPKRGFGAPLDVWLRGDLSWMLEEYLGPDRVRKRGLFDSEVVKAAVNQFLHGRAAHYRVWALVVFEMWADWYGVEV